METPRGDLVAVGEVLVDLISTRMVPDLARAERFRRFQGGQVANVARNVSLLGGHTALVGRSGTDGFGRFLRRELARAGVNTGYLRETTALPTTMVVVSRHTATPEFFVYRGADALLSPADVPLEAIARSRAVHTSAFALSQEPSRSAALLALRAAREAGCLVSLDPNYHPQVWDSADPQEVLRQACALTDVVKPSLDDCRRLFGPHVDAETGAAHFLEWGARLVVVTLGGEGVFLALPDGPHRRLSAPETAVADVTGAGDAFWAGLLVALLDGLAPERAAAVGQLVAARKLQTVGPLKERLPRAEFYAQTGGLPCTSPC